jgi:lysophospholipase L1-like esterase
MGSRNSRIFVFSIALGWFLSSGNIIQAGQTIPELYMPPEDFRFSQSSPLFTFRWENTGSLFYQIEIGLDPAFETSSGPIKTSEPDYDLSTLVPEDIWTSLSATLFWRVREYNILGTESPWSNPWAFHKTNLEPPVLLYPVNDSRFGDEPPLPFFQWTSVDGAGSYEIEFALDEDFSVSLGSAMLSETFVDFSGVDPDAWYPLEDVVFWRISGWDFDNHAGPWSSPFFFSKTKLLPPRIAWPDDKTRFDPQSDPPDLIWQDVGGNGAYQIRFSNDRECLNILGTMDLSSAHFNFGDYISKYDWWYIYANLFWSVAGYDAEGRPGPWSNPLELTKVGYHRIAVFGDSITAGECVENGYLDILKARLEPRWGQVTTANMAIPGTKAYWGEDHIEQALIDSCPEYILILFGTNDSVDPYGCIPHNLCDVAGHLEHMAQIAWNRGTTPIVSTILPLNPAGKYAGAQPLMDLYNDEIREMADRIHVPLVDLDYAFSVFGDELPDFFCDWGHPNYDGYEVMAEAYYQGIISNGG